MDTFCYFVILDLIFVPATKFEVFNIPSSKFREFGAVERFFRNSQMNSEKKNTKERFPLEKFDSV